MGKNRDCRRTKQILILLHSQVCFALSCFLVNLLTVSARPECGFAPNVPEPLMVAQGHKGLLPFYSHGTRRSARTFSQSAVRCAGFRPSRRRRSGRSSASRPRLCRLMCHQYAPHRCKSESCMIFGLWRRMLTQPHYCGPAWGLILIRFQDETKRGNVSAWQDHVGSIRTS